MGSKAKTIACGEVKAVATVELVCEKEFTKDLQFTKEVGPAAAICMRACITAGI